MAPETAPPGEPDPVTVTAARQGEYDADVYGVVCPDGSVYLTDPDPRIAWHHADKANGHCPCGGGLLSHVVRSMKGWKP